MNQHQLDAMRYCFINVQDFDEEAIRSAAIWHNIPESTVKKVLASTNSQTTYGEFDIMLDAASRQIDHIEFTTILKFDTCECGAEKCQSPRHALWCPKYEKGENQ